MGRVGIDRLAAGAKPGRGLEGAWADVLIALVSSLKKTFPLGNDAIVSRARWIRSSG